MSATRTQIYLTEAQRRQIDERMRVERVSMAEVIRRALDAYLDGEPPDPAAALAATFGANSGAEAPSRDEWARG
jgi:hypothetical protein